MGDRYTYFAYGLSLQSNQVIPGLLPIARSKIDVQIHLAAFPTWVQANERAIPDSTRKRTLIQGPDGMDYWYWCYPDGTEFLYDRAGTEIWSEWKPPLTLEDTATYLLGPVLGIVLWLRGLVCLHASVLAVKDRAIALVGEAGAGKSTTAAAMAQRGYPILTDDVAALFQEADQIRVQPAYPRIRLWPSSVSGLYGDSQALPCLTPNWDKRYLDLTQTGYSFHPFPLPLAAIYLLQPRQENPENPYVTTIGPTDALLRLVANSYGGSLLDRQMRATEFTFLSHLLQQVPVRRVFPHADLSYLPQLCDVLLEDINHYV
ncbi:MAG: hypothetical protein SFW36_00510 [Leptolyngbyaceae cyanobacterium bins.59]|nr:hypothetical protein [Leptolyngbyaceae cyanobacterium bins.59]